MEARAFDENVFTYFLQCMLGRHKWVPKVGKLIQADSTEGYNKNEHNRIEVDVSGSRYPCTGALAEYEFSESNAIKLREDFIRLHMQKKSVNMKAGDYLNALTA